MDYLLWSVVQLHYRGSERVEIMKSISLKFQRIVMWIPLLNIFVQMMFAYNCWRAEGTLKHVMNWLIRMFFISLIFAFIDSTMLNFLHPPYVIMVIWKNGSTYLLSLFCAIVVIRYQKKHAVAFFGTDS